MDAAKKALFFGAGLFLTIALITLFVMIYTTASDSSKEAQSDFSGLNAELKDQKFLVYDNTTVSGSQVSNAVRKFKQEGENGNMGVYIETGKNSSGSGKWYFQNATNEDNLVEGSSTITSINTPSSTDYVNPSGQFKATIVRDSNNVIRGLKFVQN